MSKIEYAYHNKRGTNIYIGASYILEQDKNDDIIDSYYLSIHIKTDTKGGNIVNTTLSGAVKSSTALKQYTTEDIERDTRISIDTILEGAKQFAINKGYCRK